MGEEYCNYDTLSDFNIKEDCYSIIEQFTTSILHSTILNLTIEAANSDDIYNIINSKDKNKDNFDNYLKDYQQHTSSAFYRICYKEDKGIYFILFDGLNVYYCFQNINVVESNYKKLNSVIDFDNLNNLMEFIVSIPIKYKVNIEFKQGYSGKDKNDKIVNFKFSSNVELIIVNWEFTCLNINYQVDFNQKNIETNSYIQDSYYLKNIIDVLFFKPIMFMFNKIDSITVSSNNEEKNSFNNILLNNFHKSRILTSNSNITAINADKTSQSQQTNKFSQYSQKSSLSANSLLSEKNWNNSSENKNEKERLNLNTVKSSVFNEINKISCENIANNFILYNSLSMKSRERRISKRQLIIDKYGFLNKDYDDESDKENRLEKKKQKLSSDINHKMEKNSRNEKKNRSISQSSSNSNNTNKIKKNIANKKKFSAINEENNEFESSIILDTNKTIFETNRKANNNNVSKMSIIEPKISLESDIKNSVMDSNTLYSTVNEDLLSKKQDKKKPGGKKLKFV